MDVVVTGRYAHGYNRNVVVLEGLQKQGVTLHDLHFGKKRELDKDKLRALSKHCDAIYLPSFTHLDVRRVKKLSAGAPVVFDPLISRYLSKVFDYQSVFRYSPRALKNYLKDKISFDAADLLMADTEGHKEYYMSKFNVPEEKVKVLPVGVPTEHFYPMQVQKQHDKFVVGFYGSFVPLQGVEQIVEAAHLLREHKHILFHIIGSGFDYKKVISKVKRYQLTNILMEDKVPYDKLNERINSFDIALGIFGSSLKADLVIPNKVYHYAGCKKAVISKRTTGIQELFSDEQDILLTDGSARDLTEKIILLYENESLRKQMAEAGYQLMMDRCTEKHIGGLLKGYIQGYHQK